MKTKAALESEDTYKMMLGTIGVGGGLGLLNVLWDMARTNREAAEAAELGDDGDTIAINLPPKRKEALLPEAIGAGAVGVGAYMLPGYLYKLLRKRQLKAEIEAAEGGYLRGLVLEENEEDKSKTASALSAGARDIVILSMLAGGGATYGLLEHLFPADEKPKNPRPKKVRVKGYGTVFADGPGDGPLAEGEDRRKLDKAAEFQLDNDDYSRALEGMSMTILHAPEVMEKSAAADLLGAIIKDASAVRERANEVDYLTLLTTLEGDKKAFYAAPPHIKRAAVSWVSHSPFFRGPWACQMAGEMAEVFPTIAKEAREVGPGERVILTKLASVIGGLTRGHDLPPPPEGYLEKLAEGPLGGTPAGSVPTPPAAAESVPQPPQPLQPLQPLDQQAGQVSIQSALSAPPEVVPDAKPAAPPAAKPVAPPGPVVPQQPDPNHTFLDSDGNDVSGKWTDPSTGYNSPRTGEMYWGPKSTVTGIRPGWNPGDAIPSDAADAESWNMHRYNNTPEYQSYLYSRPDRADPNPAPEFDADAPYRLPLDWATPPAAAVPKQAMAAAMSPSSEWHESALESFRGAQTLDIQDSELSEEAGGDSGEDMEDAAYQGERKDPIDLFLSGEKS